VIDCDESSETYGSVVGWTELPHAGNELQGGDASSDSYRFTS
jgi:hypothetical protein